MRPEQLALPSGDAPSSFGPVSEIAAADGACLPPAAIAESLPSHRRSELNSAVSGGDAALTSFLFPCRQSRRALQGDELLELRRGRRRGSSIRPHISFSTRHNSSVAQHYVGLPRRGQHVPIGGRSCQGGVVCPFPMLLHVLRKSHTTK